jgi:hypothetical protein
MPTRAEIVGALYGAYLLARLDPSGMDYFNRSIDGFWRSFAAALLVAPPFFAIILMRNGEAYSGVDPAWFLIVEAVRYAVGWVVFPIIMVLVARFLSLSHVYVDFIVAYNWCQVPIVFVFLPVAALSALGILPAGLTALINLGFFILVYVYLWFVARTALDVEWYVALAVVGLELITTLFIEYSIGNLLGA